MQLLHGSIAFIGKSYYITKSGWNMFQNLALEIVRNVFFHQWEGIA